MAIDNLRVLKHIRKEVNEVRSWLKDVDPGIVIGISGSAAVGADLLEAAKDSIANTELFTILLVTVILLFVYRSPLLVAIPLITIFVSFLTATGIVAVLTQLGTVNGFEWWEFKVFKTTKIFIVVILFGAGTDYCLFLISRYREELQKGLDRRDAISKAMAAVGTALAASALTTIIGLSMMFFADFGKFSNSGPAIGLCLAITLLASLTLTPALLGALGKVVFWPVSAGLEDPNHDKQGASQSTRFQVFWKWTAWHITAHPGRILVVTFALLSPLAWCGLSSGGNVTYDLLSELDPSRPSRQATQLLTEYFPVGESNAVVVLARKQGVNFDETGPEQLDAVWALAKRLSDRTDVRRVRSLATPFGRPPGKKRKLEMKLASPLVRSLYITPEPNWKGSVTRLEVVLQKDAFSIDATQTLSAIDELLKIESADPNSFWSGATFAFSGTTAAMRDLRNVTRRDNTRIEILVVIAVFAVLLIILRRPVVCVYMILTVLFTYFVAIGATELFFRWTYGDSFHGLDWKVPLFLFVILVAVGQDYNVYLATRVFEEQKLRGPFAGLRHAVERTGGIITSCGVIMAGTFISMTSGTWGSVLPDWLVPASGGALRGIVELGFALALGVMLDTFIVRPILVPAFLAMLCRWRKTA
jgi:RND superfamily putative drug exporter